MKTFARIMLCVVFMAGIVTSTAATAAVWRVDVDNAGTENGTSWATAFKTIQAAVNAAANGDEIWVAEGTYTGAADPVVTMKTGVDLYGGFAGTETLREERDWTAHVTTIDGQDIRRCLLGANDATLSGFAVTRGYATGNPAQGGGMLNDAVSPTIEDCIFQANRAISTTWGCPGGSARGGAIACVNDASPTLIRCTFASNIAQGRDGGYNIDGGCTGGVGFGGALYSSDGSPSLTDCTFTSNLAQGGNGGAPNYEYGGTGGVGSGGALYSSGGSPSLTNCTFTSNVAQGGNGGAGDTFGGAGGVGSGGALYSSGGSPSLTNCTFTSNVAQGGNGAGSFYGGWGGVGSGGALYSSGGSPSLTNCTFTSNVAQGGNGVAGELGDGGGGGACGGGLYVSGSAVSGTGNTFSGNWVLSGQPWNTALNGEIMAGVGEPTPVDIDNDSFPDLLEPIYGLSVGILDSDLRAWIDTPSSDAYFRTGPITISGPRSSNLITNVVLSTDGGTTWDKTATLSAGLWSYVLTPGAIGVQNVMVKAFNEFGGVASCGSVRFYYYPDSPGSVISSPKPDAHLSGIVTVQGTVKQGYFGLKDYVLDWHDGVDPNATGGWTTLATGTSEITNSTIGTWNTGAVADGDYVIRLTVTDTSELYTSRTYIVVRVDHDTTPPAAPTSVSITGWGIPTVTRSNYRMNASGQAEPGTVVAEAKLVNESGGVLADVTLDVVIHRNGLIGGSVSLPALSVSKVGLRLKVKDAAGNISGPTTSNLLWVDNVAPPLQIFFPMASGRLSMDIVDMCGTAIDIGASGAPPEGIAGSFFQEFTADDIVPYYDNQIWCRATGSDFWSYLWMPPAEGNYTFYIRSHDRLGNMSSPASMAVTVNAVYPSARISSPTQGQIVLQNTAAGIVGTAKDTTDFLLYKVQYAPGISPTSGYVNLTGNVPTPVVNGLLTTWNTTGLATGTYTLRLIVVDQAANNVLFDRIVTLAARPSVAMTSIAADPTNANPIPATVTFSRAMTGFVAGDITATNGTVSNLVNVGGGVYTFDLTPLAQGLVTADIPADVATDSWGYGNDAALQFSRTYDGIVPTVAMTSVVPDPTNTSPIPVTVTFSEPVTGFALGDIATTNATASNLAGGPAVYTFSLTPTADGLVAANIAAGVAADAAGNGNTVASQLSRTYDGTHPTATMTSAAPDPTDMSPIGVTVTFSEPVTGFVDTDIVTTNGTVGNFAGGPTIYTFDLTPAADGLVTANIAADVATDAVGNGNGAAQFSRNYDVTHPTVAMSSVALEPTNMNPILVTVTFSEPVSGFTLGDIVTGNGTASNLAGGPTVYTFSLTPATDGLVTADIAAGVAADAVGNESAAAVQFGRTYDGLRPMVAMSSGAPNPTNAAMTVTVTFNKPVINFTLSDITRINGTASNFAGGPSVYTFDLTPTADGLVTADIAAGVCTDTVGNPNYAAPQFSRFYDGTSPVVGMTSTGPDPTNAVIAVSVTFSEAVTGFALVDIAAGNSTAGSFVDIGGGVYTFSLTPWGNGLVTADIAANAATDAAGNGNTAAAQFSRTYDGTHPTVAMSSTAPNPTSMSPIPVTVTFSETVIGFMAGDIELANSTLSDFVSIDASHYTFNLTPLVDGQVTADIPEGVASDIAGNGNSGAAPFSRGYDSTSPTNPGATAIGTDTITWIWEDTSEDETGFKVYDDPGAGPPVTLQTTTAANVELWQHNNLTPNNQYAFQVAAIKPAGDSALTPNFTAWTLAATPVAPSVVIPGVFNSLDVAIGSGDGNPPYTVYAIHVSPGVGGRTWVQGDGSLGTDPLFQTASVWGTTRVTWLVSNTTYSFAVTARNGAGVLTAEGSFATVSTLSECTAMTAWFEAEWPSMAADLDLNGNEPKTPGTKIPEKWGLQSILAVACNADHPHHANTLAAYAYNLDTLDTESPAIVARIAPYKHVLAGILLINQSRQDHFKGLLGLQNTYEVAHGVEKDATESFSEQGDLDDDGVTNEQEYNALMTIGGNEEIYALCSVEIQSSSPLADEGMPLAAWPTALALLAVGLAVLQRRRRMK